MFSHDLKVLTYRDGTTVQARVSGPVDGETFQALQARLESVLFDHCRTLVLDLGPAEYVDSDGVRGLQRYQQELARRQVAMRLALRTGSRAARTFHLLQLVEAFTIDFYPAEPSVPAPAPEPATENVQR